MGLLSSLLSPKTGADIVKSGMGLVDNAFYTEQEKAKNYKELTEIAMKHDQMAWADNNTARSITRRWIACSITFVFLLAVLVLGIVYMIPALSYAEDGLKFIIQMVDQPFTIVLSFYFGTHAILALKGKK